MNDEPVTPGSLCGRTCSDTSFDYNQWWLILSADEDSVLALTVTDLSKLTMAIFRHARGGYTPSALDVRDIMQ